MLQTKRAKQREKDSLRKIHGGAYLPCITVINTELKQNSMNKWGILAHPSY